MARHALRQAVRASLSSTFVSYRLATVSPGDRQSRPCYQGVVVIFKLFEECKARAEAAPSSECFFYRNLIGSKLFYVFRLLSIPFRERELLEVPHIVALRLCLALPS